MPAMVYNLTISVNNTEFMKKMSITSENDVSYSIELN